MTNHDICAFLAISLRPVLQGSVWLAGQVDGCIVKMTIQPPGVDGVCQSSRKSWYDSYSVAGRTVCATQPPFILDLLA